MSAENKVLAYIHDTAVVASRLVETYYKPVILLSIDGDMAKGSCRSIEGLLHMHDALAACAEHLTQFGGHAQAAGLRLPFF